MNNAGSRKGPLQFTAEDRLKINDLLGSIVKVEDAQSMETTISNLSIQHIVVWHIRPYFSGSIGVAARPEWSITSPVREQFIRV